MSVESKLSGHWTDEQLIAFLYGVGPDDGHAAECLACQSRLNEMNAFRRGNDQAAADEMMPTASVLHQQRRAIYQALSAPRHWWASVPFGRWAPGAAAFLLLLGSGFAVYEQEHSRVIPHQQSTLSDAQLAQDVSQMADSEEPSPTAPLQALFE